MEEKKLRQYDFITAVGLILFSVWELSQALKMPMKESYGGVQSEWYVSPALLPMIIGGGLMLLGAILLVNAIRTGGAASFIEAVKNSGKIKVTEPTRRVVTVVFAFVSFIYLMIPNVDFFLSISLFLFYISTSFYPERDDFRKKMTLQFIIGMGVLLILITTGLDDVLKGILSYNVDILALLFLIYLNIYSRIQARKMDIARKTIRQVTLISLIVPLILCPLFRYFLLVPLPVEGGIIKLMNLVYYAVR
ncbi:tripartite tricarboxylate transporter TctB family protein [Spirochaeta isovalerica]|uniref:DUF1468 domain-containing protein n=1 Tax=Spirochaeta isovalerica TaxID=150 RepID=A0A841R8C2_9SPIO|nr:tripartite tricarboxylate transporter TctB family protein [Spirochaeta isovalerica]MBB6479611.1 hypothetical protein [Spirochaeta isovalerica]